MSLKNIGNLNNVTKAIGTLKGFDTFNEGAEYLNKFTKYSDQTKFDMLSSAFQHIEKDAIKTALGITDVADAASDLTDVASSATSKTSGFGTALKGVWSIIKANPLVSGAIAGGTLIAGVATGVKIYNENLQKQATEATEAWDTSLSDIQSKIQEYESLKTQLDSGTLTDTEEIAVKQQILDLQHQITESYGEQAAGIDLVNGKLETQKAMLNAISSEKADENIRDNETAYDKAKKEMQKNDRVYDLGSFKTNSSVSNTGDAETDRRSALYSEIKGKVKDIAKSFEDQGIYLEDDGYGYSTSIKFKGDATQAESVITEFRSQILDLQKDYGEEGKESALLQGILENSHTALSNNDKVLDKYQENYKAFLEQDMYRNEQGHLLSDYAQSISNYNEALMSGDTSKIHEASQAYADAVKARKEFVSQEGQEDYDVLFSDMDKELDSQSRKFFDFQEALNNTSVDKNNQFKDSADNLQKYAKQLKNSGMDVVDVQKALEDSMNSANITPNTQAINELAKAWGITSSSSVEDIRAFCDAIAEFEVVSDGVSDHSSSAPNKTVEELQKTVTDAQTNLSSFQSAINESASATGLSAESITAVGNAFSEFSELNPALLFMNTANGVKVNNKALSSLISLQHKVKSKDFSDAIKNQTQAIAEQNEVVKNASADNLAEEQGKLQKMFGDLSAIQQARSQYNALYQEQQKLFSDYGEWITDTSTENAGDPFLNMVSGLEQAKAAYDKGLVGTDEFKSFAKLISPTGATDAANFMENYGKAARYLTEDISGVQNFLSDLQTNGFAEYNAELDSWALNVRNVSDVAKKMGMGEDFISGMFGRLEDYGFHNNIINNTEDGVLKLSDAYRNLAESQSRLDKLKSEDPGNTTAIEAAEKEVQGYQQDIDELGTNLSNVAADSASAYNEELESAKDQIKILGKEYENIFKNDLYGENQDAVAQYIQDMIDGLANTYDLDSLDFEQMRQDAENYRKSLSDASIENPAKVDFGDDTEKANTYASALGKVQQANKDNKTVIEETKNALSDFTSEQIKSIDLFDGAYDSNQLEPAEKALDSLVESLGLTNEEAEMLPQLLEATGMIKPEVDTSDIEKAATEGENAQKSLEEATGKTYDFDFNTTDLDTIQKQMDTVTSDMAQYQTTDANGNVTYDYSQPGANETAKVYESTVRQQQAAEFSNTELGKNEATGGTLDTAVRAYQEAKNELDTQTLLAQQGVKNDVEGATKACNEAFQAVKDAGGEEIFDTTGIQELDDSIKNMTDKEYKAMVDVDADTSQADSKMNSITNKELQTKINTVVENGTSVDQLLAMDNKTLATTVGCEDSEVQQVRAELEEMDQQNVQCAVEIDNTQFNALIEAINGEPVTQEVQVKPTGESSITDEIEKAPSEKEVSIVGKVASLNLNGNYPPVALEGNVTNINTTGDYQSLALEGNIVQVSGGDGESIDVVGNVTSVSPVGNLSVNVVGNITSTTGGETQGGSVSLIVDSSDVDTYKPSDKSAKVKFSKDSSEPDNYQPSDKSATVTYNVDATNVLAYQPPNKSATVTYTVQTIGSPPKGGAVSCASGTMISPAHADGTAYNVLNMRPLSSAHAKGDISLNNDEKALVNEVGVESIVRDGVWSLIPGGAHFENLKKGDIVFNASQTKALLEHGRMAGHARAYADGTLSTQTGNRYGLYKAYRGGSMHGSFQGGAAGGSSSGGGNSHTTSYNNNTGAVNSNTKATNNNTKAAKKSTQVFDWVERRLKYFADKTKAIADSINDYISSSQKKSLLQKQIYATNSEMHVNYRSARAYYSKAQSLGLSSKTRKLIEEGRYSIDDIDTSTESGKAHYDKVQKYMNYYDEYTKCIDAVRELRTEQVELYAQWAAIPTEEAEKKIDKLTQSYNGLAAIQARLETANLGGSAQAMLKKQLDNTLKYASDNKKKTDKNFDTQRDRLVSIKQKETSTKETADKDKKNLNSATNALKKGAKLTDTEKKRISSGQALSTKGLKGKKKKLVEKYNAALKKSNSSKKAYQNAVSYGKGVRKDYTSAKEAKANNDKIYNEYKKYYDVAAKNKGTSWGYQNYLVDQELALLKQQNDAKNTAYRQSTKNTQTATKRKDNYKSKLDSVKKKGKSYSKKYAKYLTAEQEKQLAAGKKINTDNIKNANVKKIIDQYNIDLQNAMNSYTAATQQLTAAQEAEAEAAANAAQSQAEYAQAQVEAEKTKFDNIKKYYEQRIEYQESWNKLYDKQREYDKTHGDYTTSESFDKPINEINKAQRHQEEAAKKLQEQLNKAVKAGTIKEYSDEWLEMKSEIVDAQTAVQDYENQMEQLKQEQILVQYEEMFDRAIEKAEKFKDKIEAINSLITEDMMYDYETGHLTEFGALSIVLNAKQLDTSLTTLKDYVKKRQQIMDDFKADKFGEETYDKLMAENDASLQGALKDAQAYQQAIIGIIKDQAQAEQDALFKVIDARKDALQKKKDYYDYDKTIKNKSKEINLLKQQIAALDGVFAPCKLFNCGNVPITLFRYNRTGNGTCECGMC